MNKYYCDLHIHSCLSPCADDDMTPANIAGMATVNGLQVVALTDHNTSKNCPAFFVKAKEYGIVPIAGMELTTAEDVHAVCLFRSLEAAMEFDEFVNGLRPKIKNKADIFGHQLVMDENDNVIGEEEMLLWNASALSLEQAYKEVAKRNGVCYPAHIDRESNGVIAALGAFPEDVGFTAYELNDGNSEEEYLKRFPALRNMTKAVSSDAHVLWNINEKVFSMELCDEPYSSELVRNAVIDRLCGKQ